MFSNPDKFKVRGSHRSLHSLVFWSVLIAGVATTAAVGMLLAPKIPVNQRQGNVMYGVGVTAHGDSTGVDSGLLDAPYHLDHSVVSKQNLPEEPNPAPLAVAAYN